MSGNVLWKCSVVAAALVLAGCTGEPKSDTGYVGTWKTGTDWIESTIAIVRAADGFATRVSVVTSDGKRAVRCDWDGRCEEYVEGRLTSTYDMSTWVDEDTGHLMLESRRHILVPEEREEYQLDELVVGDDGLTLWAYSRERGGQRFSADRRPKRSYTKFSDRVTDPPRGGGRSPR
jgi:hypothetical protein